MECHFEFSPKHEGGGVEDQGGDALKHYQGGGTHH